jgi:hypothetical protein
MMSKLFIIVDILRTWCIPTQHKFLFSYMLQQVQDVLEEEKLFDILQDQTRILNSDNQVCVSSQTLEKS